MRLTEKLRTEIDHLRLEFITTEIHTAWTFARTAETMNARGSIVNAERLTNKSWEAYLKAASHLSQSPVKGDLRKKLIKKLNKIRGLLDGLPPRSNGQAAVLQRVPKSGMSWIPE